MIKVLDKPLNRWYNDNVDRSYTKSKEDENMKYNKSEIMMEAWKIRRSVNARALTFGQCLVRAWAKAKKAAEIAAQTTVRFVDGMTVTVDGIDFTLRRWTKYGMDRLYVNWKNEKVGYMDIARKFVTGDLNHSWGEALEQIVTNLVF